MLNSIILVNPQNEILLLHRVQTSSAFSAAHVFPGGNLSPQGGALVVSGVERHRDNLAYRTGAIRELFEESGILLVRKDKDSKELLSIAEPIRAAGRQIVHSEKVSFSHWLQQQSGKAVLDTGMLLQYIPYHRTAVGELCVLLVQLCVQLLTCACSDSLIPFTHWVG